MKTQLTAAILLTAWLGTGFTAAAQSNSPIPGVGPVGDVVKLHTGFAFTEGPAHDHQGNVYFTDVRTNRIHKVDLEGKLSTFLEDTKGCNGLMVDAKGRLIACQGGEGRIIAIDPKTKAITVLAAQFEGKRFNSPNDLVLDKQGGVYFTDPSFARGEPPQDKMAVYYAAPGGAVTRLISDLARPNGVILSPSEKILIVLPSGSPEVMAYDVQAPGKIGPGRVFCKLEQPATGQPRGGDGLTVDTQGRYYFTQPSLNALQVVSPEGITLGLLKFPEAPANCTFGGKDLKTLYVTARTSLYTVRMEATGHRFPGGAK